MAITVINIAKSAVAIKVVNRIKLGIVDFIVIVDSAALT